MKAGPWTPEAAVENPDAVKMLHCEFSRAGADVCQTFTFYASEDKLENRGNDAAAKCGGVEGVNRAACKIAREVADKFNNLVCGGVCQTPTYLSNAGKEKTQAEFRKQLVVFLDENVDFLLAEYFEHVEECEWAVEVLAKEGQGKAVAANMCIGPGGDMHGVSAGECAVRMAQAGAKIVGVNCHFDPQVSLQTIAKMKAALEAAVASGALESMPFLMCQPIAYKTPEGSGGLDLKQGFIDLPEFPFALEPRVCTRWDMHKFARDAWNLGVRYIGGCCGFAQFHIRAIAQELVAERGGREPVSGAKHLPWGGGLLMHTKPWVRARAKREYWETLQPASGRPLSGACSQPSNWGVTQGDAELVQQTAATDRSQVAQQEADNAKRQKHCPCPIDHAAKAAHEAKADA